MRSWLNSTAAEGKVDWLCGNPPKDGYVSGVGAYNEKAGFLNAFSKSEIAAMKTVTQRSLVSHPEYNKGIVDGDANSDLLYYTDISEAVANYDSSYFETTTEKVFLLDVKQANAVWKISKVIMLRIIMTVWLGLIGFALLLPIAIMICVISVHRVRSVVMLRGIPIWA